MMAAPIDHALSLEMFERANVDRTAFMRALVRMGPQNLKTAAMRKRWSADNPTLNYCYVIAEWVKYFVLKCQACGGGGRGRGHGAPAFRGDCEDCKGTGRNMYAKAYKLAVDGYDTLHNFIRVDGALVDLAAEQFPDYSLVRYENASPTTFMMAPSKRSRLLEQYYREELLKVEATR